MPGAAGWHTISPKLVNKVKDIVQNTEEVIGVGQILMRKSGDEIFADVTISLRGDVSFDKAHEISSNVENNIKQHISNAKVTIHFEPSWNDVPFDSKINDIVLSITDVKSVHGISSYSSERKIFVSLHVLVDREIDLEKAHKISEIIEDKIQKELPETNHVTIHLEPFISIPKKLQAEGKGNEGKIIKLLGEYKEIKKIGRIVILNFKDILKIDIDCSFDKNLSIEIVHDLTTEIEQKIKIYFQKSIITIHPEPI